MGDCQNRGPPFRMVSKGNQKETNDFVISYFETYLSCTVYIIRRCLKPVASRVLFQEVFFSWVLVPARVSSMQLA